MVRPQTAMDNSSALGTAGKHSVSLRGITKRYGSIVVNDTIDLDVVEGEFLTLLGASGSGKTTLLRIVAGLDRCDSGTVCIEGRDVTNLPARQRNLGMVFQQYSLFPHMTISENISYGLKLRGWSRRETRERVAEMLDMVRLPGVEDRLPRQLSGGQQQRVALARALAAKPEVMMLDEPLGALDLKLRKQLQIELKRIHQQTGTTFLFVTHDQEEALSMSDRIAVLRDGRIEQLASAQEVYLRPSSSFVADFIGEADLLACVRRDAKTAVIEEINHPIDMEAPAGSSRFKLVVRPEHVRIFKSKGKNRFPGKIRGIRFEGATSLYHVQINDRTTVKSRTLGAPMSGLSIGDDVWIEISGTNVVLPADAAHGGGN